MAKQQSKMNQAMKIFEKAFKKPLKDHTPRQTALHYFETKLGMAKTTAATYYSHCMKKVRDVQEAEVAESKKTPWAVVKLDHNSAVTSYGHFLTRAAAAEFNAKYQHDGLIRGNVEQGQVIDAKQLKSA